MTAGRKIPRGGFTVAVPDGTPLGTRRKLRAVACAMTGNPAPEGWVEIQREDQPTDDGPQISDELAAILVCQAARRPGLAMLYGVRAVTVFGPDHGTIVAEVFLPLVVRDGDGDAAIPSMLQTALGTPGVTTGDRWIVVVPRDVAKLAGVLR